MDWRRPYQQAFGNNYPPWRAISIRRILCCAWSVKRHDHKSYNNYRKHNRHYVRIFSIALLLSPVKVLAQTSQTAAPVANSSGSVTNMAIQSLQGNLIQNQYGGNIVCQGPMLTFSPFLTDSHTYSSPREYWYEQPIYDDDGEVSHYTSNRTGQKDNMALNLGFSMTFSIPLDNSLQRRCKQAADTQIARQQQMLTDSTLNWHIARLKNCGELKLKGIEFAANSPYKSLCEDVVVKAKMGQVLPHRHTTPSKTILPEGDSSSLDKRWFFSGINLDLKSFFPLPSEPVLAPVSRGVLQSSEGKE